MNTFIGTIIISGIVFVIFIIFQGKYFLETRKYRNLFKNFFRKDKDYETYIAEIDGEKIAQLRLVGTNGSDLNTLISEINHYVAKTKGTTDFAVIQNKVERKLNMRYDQSVAKLAFPTYLGLMGTFAGVFLGISMFIGGFNGAGDITDESIKNLLFGVLVSMSTSLIGLLLTTINNALAGESRKNIEEDKNDFYDFVQTELMPSLDVSMVLAITRLHETVDRFEPAFNRVIWGFQETFDRCTRAFGDSFEKNVTAVAAAVNTMGKNMDKINENIDYQKQLLAMYKSSELIRGLDKYIEAAEHFVSITKSLDKFEEARRMMLAATQEAINIQDSYTEALRIPRAVAVRINQILDRIKTFEDNVNRVGGSLENRQILGNDIVETIREQVNQLRKKDKIAEKYFEVADENLEKLYENQTRVIGQLDERYATAINLHMEGFEKLLKEHQEEIEARLKEFKEAIDEKFELSAVRSELSQLKKIPSMDNKIDEVKRGQEHLQKTNDGIRTELNAFNAAKEEEAKGAIGRFINSGSNSAKDREIKQQQSVIEQQQREIDILKGKGEQSLVGHNIKSVPTRTVTSPVQPTYSPTSASNNQSPAPHTASIKQLEQIRQEQKEKNDNQQPIGGLNNKEELEQEESKNKSVFGFIKGWLAKK